MGWIDRINARLTRFARRHEPARYIETDGVRLVSPNGTEKRLPFAALVGARAELRDIFVGDIVVLMLRFDDGTCVEFGQDDPNWWALMEGLDRSGRIARPSAKWQLEVIAASGDSAAIDLM